MPQNPPTRRLRLDRDRKLIRFVFSRAVDSFEVGPGEAFALAAGLVKLAEMLEPPAKKKRTKREPVEPPVLPSWMPPELWERWIAHRIEIKEPMTASMMAASLRTLSKFRELGQDIEAVIDNSVAGGYQGLFEIKGAVGVAPRQQPVATVNVAAETRRCKLCGNTGWQPATNNTVKKCLNHEYEDIENVPAPKEVVVALDEYVRKVGMK